MHKHVLDAEWPFLIIGHGPKKKGASNKVVQEGKYVKKATGWKLIYEHGQDSFYIPTCDDKDFIALGVFCMLGGKEPLQEINSESKVKEEKKSHFTANGKRDLQEGDKVIAKYRTGSGLDGYDGQGKKDVWFAATITETIHGWVFVKYSDGDTGKIYNMDCVMYAPNRPDDVQSGPHRKADMNEMLKTFGENSFDVTPCAFPQKASKPKRVFAKTKLPFLEHVGLVHKSLVRRTELGQCGWGLGKGGGLKCSGHWTVHKGKQGMDGSGECTCWANQKFSLNLGCQRDGSFWPTFFNGYKGKVCKIQQGDPRAIPHEGDDFVQRWETIKDGKRYTAYTMYCLTESAIRAQNDIDNLKFRWRERGTWRTYR